MGVERTASALRAIAMGLGPVTGECRIRGMTRLQMDVATFLEACHKATATTLVKELGVRPKLIARALSSLERHELVVRSHSPDTRGTLFGLTEVGKRLVRELALRWQTVYAELLEPLPMKDQLRVGEAMATLGDLLKARVK
jgi:DNA-binding MarR family transcriptional regulator